MGSTKSKINNYAFRTTFAEPEIYTHSMKEEIENFLPEDISRRSSNR